jgi:hypothetical protein
MRTNRKTFSASMFFAAIALAAGCKSLRPEPEVAVQVRDAETKAPIAGASVSLSDIRGTAASKELNAKTASDGVARIHALPDGNEGLLTASAAGYLNDAIPLYETKQLPSASRPTEIADPHRRQVEIELYAGPRPTIELVIPNGFRGLIKAEFKVTATDGATSPRLFRCTVGTDGVVQIASPLVLHCVLPQDFRAVGPDGTALPTGGPTTAIELRWVKTTDTIDYFVFGTEIDCNEARKTLTPADGGSGGSGSGKGSGGGGRRGGGRRGGGGGGMGGASP